MKQVDKEKFTWLVDENIAREHILAHLVASREQQILRRTPNRCVSLVKTNGTSFLLKRFHYPGIDGMLKALLRGTPAAREWNALREARERGLPSARPLALGQQEGLLKAESLVVTEVLENASPLADYLYGPARATGRKRWQVVREVAALVRKTHDLGFYQPDLHLGNILIRHVGPTMETFLVDFQRVRIMSSVSPRKRWHNLAVLHGGCMEASSTDRLRFLKHYLSYPTPLPFDLRQLVAQLERKGRRHRFNLWRSRQKRCLAENRDFTSIRAGTFAGFARREHWNQNLQSLLREPGKIFQQTGTMIVKNSTTTSVAIVDHPGGELYVKRYNYQGFGYAIKDFFRSARARRGWVVANSLHMRGIPVALSLAYLERRRFGVLLESYIFTEAKTGLNLRQIFNDFDKSGWTLKAKRAVLNALACLVKKMHAHGVAHRDLKGTNIIAQERVDGNYDLFIVDFDGISLGEVSRRRRAKDLARLAEECQRHRCLTGSDRLRFLKAYLAAGEEKNWKKIWRAVVKRSG